LHVGRLQSAFAEEISFNVDDDKQLVNHFDSSGILKFGNKKIVEKIQTKGR
jgi:hypothetical protein